MAVSTRVWPSRLAGSDAVAVSAASRVPEWTGRPRVTAVAKDTGCGENGRKANARAGRRPEGAAARVAPGEARGGGWARAPAAGRAAAVETDFFRPARNTRRRI